MWKTETMGCCRYAIIYYGIMCMGKGGEMCTGGLDGTAMCTGEARVVY